MTMTSLCSVRTCHRHDSFSIVSLSPRSDSVSLCFPRVSLTFRAVFSLSKAQFFITFANFSSGHGQQCFPSVASKAWHLQRKGSRFLDVSPWRPYFVSP